MVHNLALLLFGCVALVAVYRSLRSGLTFGNGRPTRNEQPGIFWMFNGGVGAIGLYMIGSSLADLVATQ